MTLFCAVLSISAGLAGLGAIAWYLGRVQTEARQARQRAAEVARGARLLLERQVAEERVRAAEQAARRKAMDEFLSGIHAEERAYLRQQNLGPARKRSVVVEERLYFRNLPVSNWSRQELTFHTTSDAPARPKLLPQAAA